MCILGAHSMHMNTHAEARGCCDNLFLFETSFLRMERCLSDCRRFGSQLPQFQLTDLKLTG